MLSSSAMVSEGAAMLELVAGQDGPLLVWVPSSVFANPSSQRKSCSVATVGVLS